MNENLNKELQEYYGALQYEYENSFDYFVKTKIRKKMNAIEILLDLN